MKGRKIKFLLKALFLSIAANIAVQFLIQHNYDYGNIMHGFNNIGTSVLLVLIYSIICFAFLHRKFEGVKSYQKQVSHDKIHSCFHNFLQFLNQLRYFACDLQVLIQSVAICIFNATSEIFYIIMQIPALQVYMTGWGPVVGQILWQYGMGTTEYGLY